MKKLSLLLTFFSSVLSAQNLVPNPSFEDTLVCPNGLGEIFNATNWYSSRQTPDYFNSCASSPFISIPDNFLGSQADNFANAYAGLQTYFTPGTREIIGTQLLSPLLIGQKYFVSFFVSSSGVRSGSGTNCCTNKLGILFSTVMYSSSSPAPINNFAHIYSDSIIEDTLNWVRISGVFTSDSSYNYLSIGNFFDDANTDTSKFNSWPCRAYYYVDNICVSSDSLFCGNWTNINNTIFNKNLVNVYPNPTGNIVYFHYTKSDSPSVDIVNSVGELIHPEIFSVGENIFSINLSSYDSGLYYILFQTKHNKQSQKIFLIK